MPSSNNKKRSRASVFDAIDELDSQDVRANRKRKTTSQRNEAKSNAARSQTKIHGHLMECRILLQRAMTTTTTTTTESSQQEETIEQCNQLLSTLLQARQRLLNKQNDDTIDYQQIVESSDESLSNLLQQEYETFREEWKQVLDRRHKDLRLHAGLSKTQFRVMNNSFWDQVDATVKHEELRARTSSDNVPVFDDSKVYQHMLQDFVLSSSSSAAGGSAQEAAAQRLSRATKESKKKKDVDRRASKGRKIRYVEIPKLVNFTFPVARPPTNMDEDEFFRSLFGGAASNKQQR